MEPDDYHQEEFARRSIQISDLREDLWCQQERNRATEERQRALLQNIANKEAELALRKQKRAELERKADSAAAAGEDEARRVAADADAAVIELARLKRELAETDRELQQADSEIEEARKRLEQLEVEVGSVRCMLDGRRRHVERTREELAREEREEEARQARLATIRMERNASKRTIAEQALQAAGNEVMALRGELSRAETGVSMERECIEGLQNALQQTELRRALAEQECTALSREIQALESSAEESDLLDALTASRAQLQQLSQDLVQARQAASLRALAIQGALEETRRMVADHVDQTRRQLDVTQCCSVESPLAALVDALAEARRQSGAVIAERRRLDAEREATERELREAEGTLAAERLRLERKHAQELESARKTLATAKLRSDEAEETARLAEAAALEAERESYERESVPRSKLEELWRMLRQQSIQLGMDPLSHRTALSSGPVVG